MNNLLKISVCVFLSISASAELRLWTVGTEEQVEGEYVAVQMNKVLIRNAEGKDIRIPLKDLSEDDLRYVELANPPDLKVDFLESSVQRNPKPSPIWVNNSPVGCLYHRFGARVTQKGAGEYKHQLTAEVFAISQQIYDRDKYHLIYRKKYEAFVLTKEKGRKFEFKDQAEIKMIRYIMAEQHPRGEKFAEYLVLVRDERGEIVGYNSSKKWLYEGLDKLLELPVGAWFNKACIRVHPTSPKESMIL